MSDLAFPQGPLVDSRAASGLPASVPLRSAFFDPPDLIAERRLAYAQAALREGDHCAAIDVLEQTLELIPHWATAWLLLAQAHLAAGAEEAACAALGRLLTLDPDDRLGAGAYLARLGMRQADGALSPAYVTALFDDYAPRFEASLTGALQYRGPTMLLDAMADARQVSVAELRFACALDLGCGTGLMGVLLRPLCDRLEGCDCAAAMLAQASEKQIYDHLVLADAISFTRSRQPGSVQLIAAADMAVYIGDLRPLFAAAARALTDDGLLAFTTQDHDGPHFGVGEDLRYGHAVGWLRDALTGTGFTSVQLAPGSIRLDRGQPVPGNIVTAQR